jgi:hypothetical protein
MADVNANIGIHIDSSAALAELKTLQRQLATFHASIAKNSAASAAAQKGLQQNLLNSINATGKFHAQMGLVRTSTESFTHALENNKLSMREYFRYAGASSKSFGKLFKSEFDTIGKVAEERVRKMQTQYIKMGRDASGAMKAMSVTPATLNINDYGNKTAVASQKQAIFNQLVKQGSTSLLNFGKNTQWAGRQLMVGFSVPLMYIGSIASKTFMDMEEQAIRFKRVYGDIFTTSGETEKAVKEIEMLAKSFTKYGIALTDTMKMAADAAAMGKTGAELTAQISEATRLAVLGGVEQQQALETTISLTNAFGVSADQLASKINFLNAVENQTVVSIEDLTIAIPKAGPVIKQLGGDVEDLAFFLTAMKEGGINASEGANALKSGLAALINPSKKASDMLMDLGVNINGIVEANAGDIKATVVGFAQALDTLDPLNRARAIEQLFGKFQFARLSTLFQNITQDGTQANKVLGLTQASVEELAILSQRELKKVEDAVGVNFKQSLEDLKIAIMPIGKAFLEALTPIVKFAADILKKFDGLGDGTKKFIVVATTLVGILGPTLLMTFGLVANGAANIIKLFLALRTGFLKLGGNATVLSQQTSYLNAEQLEAATVAASLNQAHTRLTQSFTLETSAVNALRNAYVQATTAALTFARANPGMMMPGFKGTAPKKFKQGATYVPGTGNKDTVPSMLTPGEAIIPANVAQNPAYQPIIDAMVNGNIQGFEVGSTGVSYSGREYNAKSARGAKGIQTFLSQLIEEPPGTLTHVDPKTKSETTFTKTRLLEVLDSRFAKASENKFTLSEIKEKLAIGGAKKGSGISSSKGWINRLTKEAGYPNQLAEQESIEKYFKDNGLNPSQDQRKNLFQVQAAHVVEEVGPDGQKIFKAKNITPDSGWSNNYINTVKGKLGQNLLELTDDQLSKLGIDRESLSSLVKGDHPTTAKLANTLDNIAKYHVSIDPNNYQAHAVVAGMDYRKTTGFYPTTGARPTIADLFPENKNVMADILKNVDPDPDGIFTATDENVKNSKFKNEPVTKLGKRINPTTGYSFKEANHIGGIYQNPDGTRVFVKPMMTEDIALAEQRLTEIGRKTGLQTPEQTLRVIEDPRTGKKLFALESPYNETFDPAKIPTTFSEDDYFKQVVGAGVRGDTDLKKGNLGGNALTDVGRAGVLNKASGMRYLTMDVPSMKEIAEKNLGGVSGPNAARSPQWFGNATVDIAKNMTSDDYNRKMLAEINRQEKIITTALKDFNLTPEEKPYYDNMLKRLREGKRVDWRELHKLHTSIVVKPDEEIENVKTKKTKKPKTETKPGNVKSSSKNPKDSKITTPPKKGERVVQGPPKRGPRGTIIRPGFANAPISRAEALANLQGMAPPRSGVPTMEPLDLPEYKRQSDALKANLGAVEVNTVETKKTTNRIKELGNKGNVAIGALTGLTVAGTFAGGKIGEMANSAMPFVFAAQGVSGIMSLMPDSMTKMKGGMIAATAVIATFITVTTLLNKAYNDAQNKAMELSEATGTSAKAIENFAVFANKATPGQILDERNKQKRSGFSVQQGKTSFGESYVAAPDNQALIQGVAENIKKNPKTAMQDLTKQLSVAVASGVFTPEQARSVAVNIGEQIGNVGIGLQASAQLTELYGEDGSNLLKDPLTLRVKLMEEATKGIAGDTKNLGLRNSATNAGASAMNQNLVVGGAVASGAAAGVVAAGALVAQFGAVGATLGPVGVTAGLLVGSLVAGGVALMQMKKTSEELGRLSGISVQNQQNALNVNKEMSASVQLYYENLIKVKNAEGDIEGAKEAQAKYDQARAKLAEQNAKTVKAIADSYKSTSGNSQKALVDAAKKATGKKYKGTEQEAYVGEAQKLLANNLGIANNGKKGQMEYVLTMQMNAGNINPSDIMAIIQTFGKSEKSMDKVMNIITKFGGQKAAETQQILGAFVDKNGNPNTKAQTEFLLNVSEAKTSAEADRLLNFYGAVSQNEGILDVGVMVNYFQNNPEAAARLQGLLDNIKKNEGKLTYDVVTNFLPPTGDVAINKEYFNKLNQAQRTVYTQEVATVISMSDAQITRSKDFQKWLSEGKPLGGAQYANLSFANQRAAYADAIGQKVTNNRIDLAIAPPTSSSSTSGDGSKQRDTTLDELLKKLKFVRDASIDAEGSIKYLMKVVSGDGITKFAGVSQQLMAGLKGGLNREFISMLESMDNKTRAIYMTVKNGQVVLTNQGKALKVAFDEKVVGEYQDAQVKTLQDTIAQQAAFVKLKAAGVDTSTALEMVSDANLAVAINGKKITSTELVRMASAAKAAKDSAAGLAMELEKAADAAKNDLVDAMSKLKALVGAKGLGFDTESLKIIADSPELINSMTQLLAGKGTKEGLNKLKTKIVNMINNIKDLKIIVDVDINMQTSADFLQGQFDAIGSKFSTIADLLKDKVNEDFADRISNAEAEVQRYEDQINDVFDPTTGTFKKGLESKVGLAQEALDQVSSLFDDFITALEDRSSLATMTASAFSGIGIKDEVIQNLIDSTKAVNAAQDAVDAQTELIKSMTDAQNINLVGLAPYRGKDAGSFKTMGSIADAERQIAIVENNIKTKISNRIEDLQQEIDGQQRTLEVGYTRLIEDVQKKIAAIERNIAVNFEIPLKNMQEESSKLSEDLAVMDKAADAVNDKYTKQEEALSKIAEINQDIVEQQKQQLGLADALSKGDISAAASAVQDIRATQAAKSLGAQQGALGKARDAELAAIKSPSGLTKDQIAERQYAIERSSYRIQQLQAIEQQKIVDFQERIYQIETNPERLGILQLIKDKEEEIYNLDLQRTHANNAIRTVQDQIAASNLSISAQQATLAAMESTLSTAQTNREKALEAAQIAHKKIIKDLEDALTAAQTALKNANDSLALSEAKLAAIEKERDAAIKQITDEEDKFTKLTKAIEAAAKGIDTAKLSVENLKSEFNNAYDAAVKLMAKLAELNKEKVANEKQNSDEAAAAAAGYTKTAIDARAEVKRLEGIIAGLEVNTVAYEKASKAKDAAQATSALYDKIAQLFKDVIAGTMSLAVAKQLAAPLLGNVDNTPVPYDVPGSGTGSGGSGTGSGGSGTGSGGSNTGNSGGTNQTGNTSITTSPVGTIKTYPSGTKVEKVRDAAYNGSTLIPSLYKVSSPGQNTFYYTQDTLPAMYKAKGGLISKFASGGIIPKMFAAGGFSKGTDTIPAMLTPGEFVIKKSAVDSYGVNNLSKINSGMSPDSSVYNYSLSVNVSGNNLNADDIASTVMQKIKYIDGQRVRGQR